MSDSDAESLNVPSWGMPSPRHLSPAPDDRGDSDVLRDATASVGDDIPSVLTLIPLCIQPTDLRWGFIADQLVSAGAGCADDDDQLKADDVMWLKKSRHNGVLTEVLSAHPHLTFKVELDRPVLVPTESIPERAISLTSTPVVPISRTSSSPAHPYPRMPARMPARMLYERGMKVESRKRTYGPVLAGVWINRKTYKKTDEDDADRIFYPLPCCFGIQQHESASRGGVPMTPLPEDFSPHVTDLIRAHLTKKSYSDALRVFLLQAIAPDAREGLHAIIAVQCNHPVRGSIDDALRGDELLLSSDEAKITALLTLQDKFSLNLRMGRNGKPIHYMGTVRTRDEIRTIVAQLPPSTQAMWAKLEEVYGSATHGCIAFDILRTGCTRLRGQRRRSGLDLASS